MEEILIKFKVISHDSDIRFSEVFATNLYQLFKTSLLCFSVFTMIQIYASLVTFDLELYLFEKEFNKLFITSMQAVVIVWFYYYEIFLL